jgi:RDD family protein
METLPPPTARRAMAWAVDFLIVAIPATALIIAAVTSLVHALPEYLGGVAADIGWSRLASVILHRDGEAGGLGAAATAEWTSFVQPLVWSLLAVPVIQFVYHGFALAWRGRTLGAIITGVRVGAATDPTGLLRARALRRAFLTALIESGFLCLALTVVVIGQLSIGALLVAAAVAAFWLNWLTLLAPRRRTLVDRLAGTTVIRSARLTPALATPAAPTSMAVEPPPALTDEPSPAALPWTTSLPAAQLPAAAEPAGTWPTAVGPSALGRAGQAAADAAAVAGQLARDGAESIARSQQVQQALNSATAQRAQELGSRATDSARRLGGRAQEMWAERRRRRTPPPPEDQ